MRTELTILEQIDLYLSGKMTGIEHAAFESKITADTTLAETVKQQKDLIKAVNRKALRAQINTVAAGGATGSGYGNLFFGIGGVLAVGLLILGAVYYFSSTDSSINSNNLTENSLTSSENDANIAPTNNTNISDNLATEESEMTDSIIANHTNHQEEDRNNLSSNIEIISSKKLTKKNLYTSSGGVSISEIKNNSDAIVINEYDGPENKSAPASYPGGIIKMDHFTDKHLQYPRSARIKKVEGVVRCDFLVTEDGLITEINAKCIKMNEQNGPAFNTMKILMNKRILNAFVNNATHILRTMPNWEPAKNTEGNPIISAHRMYFNYDMEKGCLVYQLEEE